MLVAKYFKQEVHGAVVLSHALPQLFVLVVLLDLINPVDLTLAVVSDPAWLVFNDLS